MLLGKAYSEWHARARSVVLIISVHPAFSLPFRRPKWEQLGLQQPKGSKPSAKSVLSPTYNSSKPKNSRPKSDVPPKKRKPKEKVEASGNDMDEDHEGIKPSSASKPRARKSDGEGGSSQKRAKNNYDGDGLLDNDEDSADRRAVENLIEAARGNIGGEGT